MKMNIKVTDILSDPNLLLIVATILVIYLSPAVVYCLLVPDKFLNVLIIILEGFYAARIIRSAGKFLLREPVNPWYARSYSLVFLIIFSYLVNIFVLAVDLLLADITLMSKSMPFWARALAITPIEFAWVILLDWRTSDLSSSDGPDWMHIPRNSHFRN